MSRQDCAITDSAEHTASRWIPRSLPRTKAVVAETSTLITGVWLRVCLLVCLLEQEISSHERKSEKQSKAGEKEGQTKANKRQTRTNCIRRRSSKAISHRNADRSADAKNYAALANPFT